MMLLFLDKEEVMALQLRTIDEFGGSHGLRDEGALDSALAAAENRAHYERAGLAACATTYAYHLTQSHAFIDGNKRIAAAVAEVFLELNGGYLDATNDQIVDLFLAIAAGLMTREEAEKIFVEWVKMD